MSTSLCKEIEALTIIKPQELRARWCEVSHSVVPNIGPDLLRRGIAYRLQERAKGGLTGSIRRENVRLVKRLGQVEGALGSNTPAHNPGTRLVRSWHDRMHQVFQDILAGTRHHRIYSLGTATGSVDRATPDALRGNTYGLE